MNMTTILALLLLNPHNINLQNIIHNAVKDVKISSSVHEISSVMKAEKIRLIAVDIEDTNVEGNLLPNTQRVVRLQLGSCTKDYNRTEYILLTPGHVEKIDFPEPKKENEDLLKSFAFYENGTPKLTTRGVRRVRRRCNRNAPDSEGVPIFEEESQEDASGGFEKASIANYATAYEHAVFESLKVSPAALDRSFTYPGAPGDSKGDIFESQSDTGKLKSEYEY